MFARPRELSSLGVGVGLRSAHVRHILATWPEVGWFELLAENYMVAGGRPLEVLDLVSAHYPVALHGVGLYAGSAHGIDRAHLARLASLARRARALWVTEHLCFGSASGVVSHDLLPLPYTREALARTVENVRRAAGEIELPFAIENVSSYVAYRASEMTEWQFLSEVAERADVGILLDVNNVYVSAVNHGFDPYAYIEQIPHERVVQIHVAGHERVADDLAIDTHDHQVVDEVWDLYARALELTGPVPTLLEWDARIPPFDEVLAEARKAERYLVPREEVRRAV